MQLPAELRGTIAAIARRITLRRAALAVFAFSLGYFVAQNYDYLSQQIRYELGFIGKEVRTTPVMNANVAVPLKVAPNALWIPSIGLEAVPVNHVDGTNEDAYQKALLTGVGHFPGTAEAGQLGNVYLFGHSSDYASSKGEYKTVFALLSKLEVGDTIMLSGADGTPYEYAVTDAFVVDPNDVSVLDQFNNERRLLTLQTSWPLGTALQRYIVRAELVTEPR